MQYTVVDENVLEEIARGTNAAEIPIPVPQQPMMLSRMGVLRLQVTVKLFTSGENARTSTQGEIEYDSWIRVKVCRPQGNLCI